MLHKRKLTLRKIKKLVQWPFFSQQWTQDSDSESCGCKFLFSLCYKCTALVKWLHGMTADSFSQASSKWYFKEIAGNKSMSLTQGKLGSVWREARKSWSRYKKVMLWHMADCWSALMKTWLENLSAYSQGIKRAKEHVVPYATSFIKLDCLHRTSNTHPSGRLMCHKNRCFNDPQQEEK